MSNRRAAGLVAVLLLAGVLLAAWWLRPAASTEVGPTSAGSGATSASAGEVRVLWVADGDTVDVSRDGVRTRVRLLGIDAPEIGHDGVPDQCLAAQARDALTALLPAGALVRLDAVGHDRYGRLLAALWLGDGRLANAEIVRAGLAAPLVVGGDVRLREPVLAARDAAARDALGLHAATGCSLPGRAATLAAEVAALPRTAPDAATAAGPADRADALAAQAADLRAELDADARNALAQGLTDAERMRVRVSATRLRAEASAAALALRARR